MTIRKSQVLINSLLLISFWVCGTVFAQDEEQTFNVNKAKYPDLFSFEYGTPSNPALTLIEGTGVAVTEAKNLQAFAVAIGRATQGSDANLAYGFDLRD